MSMMILYNYGPRNEIIDSPIHGGLMERHIWLKKESKRLTKLGRVTKMKYRRNGNTTALQVNRLVEDGPEP